MDGIKHGITACIPLVLLVLLVMTFSSSITNNIRCISNDCEAINKNLSKILLQDDWSIYQPLPLDSEVDKRVKEFKVNQRTTAIYNGRVYWLFFKAIYTTICAIALGIGCFVIYKSFDEISALWGVGLVLLALTLAGIFGLILYSYPHEYMSMLIPLFNLTIEEDIKQITGIMTKVNSFGFAVTLLLTLATCAVLFYSPPPETKPMALLKNLSLRMRNLRIILFIGTAMLIAGIFLIQSFYHWALAFILQDAEIIKNAEGFFTRILATEGAYFTLILAVVYLPAAFILQARVDSTTELLTDAKEKEEALKKYNLSFSLTESLPRLLAILGPFLAGPVGELFSRLFK